LLPWPPTSHCTAPISSLPRSSSAPETDDDHASGLPVPSVKPAGGTWGAFPSA
jgi:hypothetical protein